METPTITEGNGGGGGGGGAAAAGGGGGRRAASDELGILVHSRPCNPDQRRKDHEIHRAQKKRARATALKLETVGVGWERGEKRLASMARWCEWASIEGGGAHGLDGLRARGWRASHRIHSFLTRVLTSFDLTNSD